MVIVNSEFRGCTQISSDQRRHNCVTGCDAPPLFSSTEPPDVSYAQLYDRAKCAVRTSYERFKQHIATYLSAPAVTCARCERQIQPPANTHRFSDTFVEKVQSQKRTARMPCCSKCKRPRPPYEYYCACEDMAPPPLPPQPPQQPRRIYCTHSYRHLQPPPLAGWPPPPPPPKRRKRWWCRRRKHENWPPYYCMCHQPRYNQPPMQPPTMMQRVKHYCGRDNRRGASEVGMYNAYVDEMSKQCWCGNGNMQGYGEVGPRPHTRRSSVERVEFMHYSSSDDGEGDGGDDRNTAAFSDIEDDDDDEDDCCCCCPCRKNFNNTNMQTEETNVADPKDIDTQTEKGGGGAGGAKRNKKRRCCRCCRQGCATCAMHNDDDKNKAKTQKKSKWKKHKQDAEVRLCEGCGNRPECRCGRKCQSKKRGCGSRRQQKRTHTIICRTASVQHSPGGGNYMDTNGLISCARMGTNPCQQMQNVMFGQVAPTPLLLDKYFNPLAARSYMNGGKPIATTSATCLPPHLDDDPFTLTGINLTTKTKKRFLNVVCDSILSDLTSNRRGAPQECAVRSLTNLMRSPDSGFTEPKSRKSLLNFKRHKTRVGDSMDCLLQRLKPTPNDEDGKKKKKKGSSSSIGEASLVVRGILEEMSNKQLQQQQQQKQRRDEQQDSDEILGRDSLRSILRNLTHNQRETNDNARVLKTKSDSRLPVGMASPGSDDTESEESYRKLLVALDALRERRKDPGPSS